jgi:hypothetical protein
VEKTQWHPLADRRIAWVRVPGDPDPLRVVEGDVVDGLLITAIEPSGVVFERDGRRSAGRWAASRQRGQTLRCPLPAPPNAVTPIRSTSAA